MRVTAVAVGTTMLAWCGLAAIAAAAPRSPRPAPPQPSREALEFFEREVRPVLAEHCFPCHGPRVQQAGLRLDTRAGALKGGEKGPALVPGRPEASRILSAVRHQGLAMPPGKKLPEVQIAGIERWIRMGAPWPVAAAAGPALGDQAAISRKAREHWSFRPVPSNVAIPRVRQAGWVRTPLDAFVLARLERAGMLPSPPADRRTLIRRVYFDLIGLPPAREEVEAFESDRAPGAYERVVDRLLASPRYGERWARHWLDVARYADTKDGVLMYDDARVRPYAYTYRDYVIRAFNEDLPYDRFIHEQLAADQIEPRVEPWRLSAMGFLTLGRMFCNNVHDVIDDRIDVVSRGMMGVTVSCARCHDHKYDPIPTADYYSLYGVFASSEAPIELPLIDAPERLPGYAEFEKTAGPKRQALQQFLDAQYVEQREAARRRVPDYLARAATEKPDPLETAIFFLSLAPEDLRPQIVHRWRRFLEQRARPGDPVFGPWHDLMALPDAGFSTGSAAVLERWRGRPAGIGPGQLNPLVRELLSAAPAGRAELARAYGKLILRVYDEANMPGAGASPLPESRRQLLEIITSPDSPAYFPKGQTYHYMSRTEKDKFGGMLVEMDKLAVNSPNAPPRAMVLHDVSELHDTRIFVRGNPAQPGERVPRRFLKLVGGERRRPFTGGSGRLDLARAITARDNPLTARVIVNRVWMHHFGEPLAPTPSDFGLRSPPPTHPELLDYLAAEFINRKTGGWSLKRLHRSMVLSSTYRQASEDRTACRTKDPENRLLWRANRRRLDLETMRDAMLAVAGRLDTTMGGRPVDVAGNPACRRRTVYGMVDRQSLPGLFRAFDFASPDASAERRPRTTVPQQALYGLNAPFVREQAKALAALSAAAASASTGSRVNALYRLALGREARPDEVEAANRFITPGAPNAPAASSSVDAWQQFAQVLLLTNEFLYLD